MPPQSWIEMDHRVATIDATAPDGLTLERLVQGLRREVKAGADAGSGRIRIRLDQVAALSGRIDIESNRFDS